jgi:Fic family protein
MNRMFDEMLQAGLPEPNLHQTDAGFSVTLFNSSESERAQVEQMISIVPSVFASALDRLFAEGRISTGEAAGLAGVSLPTVRRYFRELEERGLLERVSRSPRDPHAYWRPPKPLRGRWRVPALIDSARTRKLS